MNVGFISTRLAGVDGVSLETAKMAQVMQEFGHDVFYLAGELDEAAPPGRVVPAMHFNAPTAKAHHDAVFGTQTVAPELIDQIYAEADTLRQALTAFIDDFGIDLIIPQNASTIPMNIALGVAITETIRRRQIKTICHHHDFYWERDRFMSNGIQDILDDAFPPDLSPIRHLTINRIMQRRLKVFRGIQSHYLPNVFDFASPPPPMDAYAQGFRQAIGLQDDDLIVLQPTRLVRRKAIEKAIELVQRLDDPRLVLVITGYAGDEPGLYAEWLQEQAAASGIRYQFIGDRVGAERGEQDGQSVFTLWDIYPHAHFITYPSVYEGFGNALIETCYFRKPLVVHRYSMYLSDIKPAGIQAVEFSHDITPAVIQQTQRLIDDEAYRQAMVDNNYAVGMQHFSYDVLRDTMRSVLQTLD